MDRPTDPRDAFEAELAALVPAAPSADLRRRVAAALAAGPAVRPARGRWLAERLVWACGGAAAGALAASLAFVPAAASRPPAVGTPDSAAPAAPALVAAAEPPVEVAEEAVAWDDAGVQFLDQRTPARILRRVAVERHRLSNGVEYRVPREDYVLLPVAVR